MLRKSIDEMVVDWIVTISKEDQPRQMEYFCSYRKLMDSPLAFWYTKTNYEAGKERAALYFSHK